MSRHKRYAHGGSAKTITHSQVRVEGEGNTPPPKEPRSSYGSPVEPPNISPLNSIFEIAVSSTASISSWSISSSAQVETGEDDGQFRLRQGWMSAPSTLSLDAGHHDTRHALRDKRETRRKAPYPQRGRPSKSPVSLHTKDHIQSEYLRGLNVPPVQCYWEEEDEFDYSSLDPLSQLALGTYDFSDAPPEVMDLIRSLPDPSFTSPVPSSSHSYAPNLSAPTPPQADPPLGLFPPTQEDMLQYAPFRFPPAFWHLMDNPGQISVDGNHFQWHSSQLRYPYPSGMSVWWVGPSDNDHNAPTLEPVNDPLKHDHWDSNSSWIEQGRLP